MNKSRIMELGTRIMKFFVVGKRTLLRVKSNRIDEDTDPNYLKIKVNHDSLYESPSKYEVLETLSISENFILNKKRRFVGKNVMKTVLKLKKTDNYFVDFLSYITKKKKVKIKAVKKQEFLSNYTRTRGTTPANIVTQNTTKKSFSEYVDTNAPGKNLSSFWENETFWVFLEFFDFFLIFSIFSIFCQNFQFSPFSQSFIITGSPSKSFQRKKTIAIHASSRLEEASSMKKNLMAHIEEDESFVLSYKRNSGIASYRNSSRMSQSGFSFPNVSRIRDSSPHANLHIFSKLRNNKSFKSTDSEYAFLKEFVCAQIENEEYLEKNRALAGDMNFKEKYDGFMVKFHVFFWKNAKNAKNA